MKGFQTYFTFLERNKLFTFVNVAGLSISLMFVLLIANMVTRQLTIDKDLKDADRISIFANEVWAGAHYNLGDRLASRYPEIEDWCALRGHEGVTVITDNNPVTAQLMSVRKNFFDFFSFALREGNREHLLTDDNSMVITRSAALRLFGTEHAMGKTLTIKNCNNQVFTVTGIIEDIDNSVMPSEAELFIPFENMKYLNPTCAIEQANMGNAAGTTLFLRTAPGADLNGKSDDVVNYMKEFFWIYQYGSMKEAHFIPLRDFYFSNIWCESTLNQYDFKLVIIFITVGILILLMAVFNYVSMSVAQTSYRAKEMATRRLLGSSRPDIFWHMIAESFLLTAVAFTLGFILAKAAEPVAMRLLDVKLNLTGDLTPLVMLAYLTLILILSLLSGFFPATILSNYNPLDVVKGTFRRKTKSLYLRLLNVVQCGLTVAMLACTLYLSVQLYRILHAPLGYEYGNVLTYPPMAEKNTLQLFRNEALKLPFVKQVSFSQGLPINGGNNNTMQVQTRDSLKEMSFQTFTVDSAFTDIYHIRITEDRHMTYNDNTYFVSENTMKELGNTGQTNEIVNSYGYRMRIAGQFKDFHIRSLAVNDPHPLLMRIAPADSIYPWNISIEVQNGDLPAYKRELDGLYSRLIEGVPFESAWYHDLVSNTYAHFFRINKLIGIFTCAALLISLLGLTAMSIYFIAQRKRDIAIRKVFGSSTGCEMRRLMLFSLTSLTISLLVSIPLIVFGVYQIDKIVTYESTFPWWIPITAFLIVTLISLGSVYLVSHKATRENPVNNLKTE